MPRIIQLLGGVVGSMAPPISDGVLSVGHPSRLKPVTCKVERAKAHIRALDEEVVALRLRKPYTFRRTQDPQTGNTRLFVTAAEQPSHVLSLIAGDAINNLRSALDHLVYQLVCDCGGSPSDGTPRAFPILATLPNAKARKRMEGQINGMSPEAKAVIRRLQPYETGRPELGALHELNNIDKHRLLLTVGYGVYRAEFSYRNTNHPLWNDPAVQSLLADFELNRSPPVGSVAPLGVVITGEETEIATLSWPGGPSPSPDEEFDLAYDVVLAESGFVENRPVVDVLGLFASAVEDVIAELSPHFKPDNA